MSATKSMFFSMILANSGNGEKRSKKSARIASTSLVELAVSCAMATNAAMKVLRSVWSLTLKISSN